jgi:hypothetical protein
MSRDHFSKVLHSPYFRTDYYQNESPGGKMEKKIEGFLKKLFRKEKK